MENDKFVNGSTNVTNVLNRFFIRKGKKIVENLNDNLIDPMKYYKKKVAQNVDKFRFQSINMSELRKILSELNKTTSLDYFGISMKMIWKIKSSLEPILLNLVNATLKEEKFPEVLKINKIIPIPKDNNYLEPENYRAINIFNPISKIIEKSWSKQITKYLNEENYLTQNHQGGIKNRGTTQATLNIQTKINKIIDNKGIAVVIALDQSACFEIIQHSILLKKMKWIGFDESTCKLIESFLSERKQYVHINAKDSEVLLCGNLSVFQGSVLSTIFYNIFTLDIPNITHSSEHNSHSEYYECSKPFIVSYIDDCFSVFEANNSNIWDKVKEYLEKMKNYYTSNKLKINMKKTQIMFVGNKEKIRGSINLEGNEVFNKPMITILGTIFSENARFNDNVKFGKNNLLTQLKRRSSSIIRIAKNYSIKFRSQLIYSLLIGKINFNLATWGNVNCDIKAKINGIISQTVEATSLIEWYGKTLKWKMKKMNIPTYYTLYNDAVSKFTYSCLNDKVNMLAHCLTENRNIRLLSQNKCGTFQDDDMYDTTKRSFVNMSMSIYNKLPRGLTLSPNKELFRKWLKKYHRMGEFDRFPYRCDNTAQISPLISHSTINECSFDHT